MRDEVSTEHDYDFNSEKTRDMKIYVLLTDHKVDLDWASYVFVAAFKNVPSFEEISDHFSDITQDQYNELIILRNVVFFNEETNIFIEEITI